MAQTQSPIANGTDPIIKRNYFSYLLVGIRRQKFSSKLLTLNIFPVLIVNAKSSECENECRDNFNHATLNRRNSWG